MMFGGGGGGWMTRGGGAGGWGRGMGGRMGLDQEPEGGHVYDHAVVLRLFIYLIPHWKKLFITITAILIYTSTVVALPWMIKLMIDDYVRSSNLSGLSIVVPLFILIALVQYGSQYVHLRTLAFVGQRVLYTLRVLLFAHLQRLSMSFYNKNEVGRVMSRVQNDVQQLQEFLSIVTVTLADVLSLTGIIVAMVLMNAKLALITLSIIPLLFVIMAIWQKLARRAFIKARKTIAAVNSGLQENISGVRVVQSLNREKANIRSFGAANADNLGANLEVGKLQAVLFPAVEMLSAIGMALVIYFGGSLVLDDSIEVGVLVAFALYIQRFFEPVLNLTMQYGSLQRAMASGARIFELLDIEPEILDTPRPIKLGSTNGNIRFEDVDFGYNKNELILKQIDFNVEPGHTVALVGPTGAGKTTLISLIMRLYDVSEGRITLGGFDIRDISLDVLSSQISVVPQEPYLFSDTVRNNIRYNRYDISDDTVVDAAKAVGAHSFIEKLEQGYDTLLQERGGNLSIGQRQLISFARALVSKPNILLLDEATANIDTHTELIIQEALKTLLKDRTAIVIAHRLSTIRNADRILVLDDGHIVEDGSHSELLKNDGLYSRLNSYSLDGTDIQSISGNTTDSFNRIPSVEGNWKATLNSPRGIREGKFKFVISGSSLSGLWESDRGSQSFEGGTVEGSSLFLTVQIDSPRGVMDLVFTGLIEGERITGTVGFGSFGSGTFLLERSN